MKTLRIDLRQNFPHWNGRRTNSLLLKIGIHLLSYRGLVKNAMVNNSAGRCSANFPFGVADYNLAGRWRIHDFAQMGCKLDDRSCWKCQTAPVAAVVDYTLADPKCFRKVYSHLPAFLVYRLAQAYRYADRVGSHSKLRTICLGSDWIFHQIQEGSYQMG